MDEETDTEPLSSKKKPIAPNTMNVKLNGEKSKEGQKENQTPIQSPSKSNSKELKSILKTPKVNNKEDNKEQKDSQKEEKKEQKNVNQKLKESDVERKSSQKSNQKLKQDDHEMQKEEKKPNENKSNSQKSMSGIMKKDSNKNNVDITQFRSPTLKGPGLPLGFHLDDSLNNDMNNASLSLDFVDSQVKNDVDTSIKSIGNFLKEDLKKERRTDSRWQYEMSQTNYERMIESSDEESSEASVEV
eukprot:TRINITY_DN5597_c0_g2_i1.p1 TRINITY_DN5597_c0_g2~~TRINITY_DN5597_c0_g2_i1.p1  ORF type:complete len:253 (-),score=79.18 TRINITY_DN5597_c0_g2_i1:67-798(-)